MYNLVDSLPRPRGVHGESKQTLEGGINDLNWSAKVLTTNQPRLGGYNNGKLG